MSKAIIRYKTNAHQQKKYNDHILKSNWEHQVCRIILLIKAIFTMDKDLFKKAINDEKLTDEETMELRKRFKKYFKHTPYVRETPKVGRNEPCPCGSGLKFKKCCGK